MKPKDLCGIPWMLAFALRADGWYLRSDIIWEKPNPMPESVTDRPTKAHEYLFLLTKSAKYFYDNEAIKDPQEEYERRRRLREKAQGLNSTYQIASEGKTGQNAQSKSGAVKNVQRRHELAESGTRNKRTVWTIPTQPVPEAHFATFPEKLIEPCILAGTSERGCCVECGAPWFRVVEKSRTKETPNMSESRAEQRGKDSTFVMPVRYETTSKTIGWKPSCECLSDDPLDGIDGARGAPFDTKPCTVLDPFGGAMTTAIVAHRHGRKFIMIELSQTYIDEIGIPRIEKATKQKGWNRFK